MSAGVRLLGGPYGGTRVELARTPRVILVGEHPYERIDDPDTGAFLEGYATTTRAGGAG